MTSHSARPRVAELRLSAFKSHLTARFGLGELTLLTGASGSGKSSMLQAYGVLARLGRGDTLDEAFAPLTGGAAACVPHHARPDDAGRRGLRIGCTVTGPAGEVHLDVAIQAEPEVRIVGERLTAAGQTLLSTALRDPGRRQVQASWRTAGSAPVTRAPMPDDRLAAALVPLRIGGRTEAEQRVVAAAEQVVVALRSVFPCDPLPERMRAAARAAGRQLTPDCRNLATVLRRVRGECSTRHALLVAAAAAGCSGPVQDVDTELIADGAVRAVLERGDLHGGRTPVGSLGDGELRYLALAMVLLTGPGVLAVDPAAEVLPARQSLTVLADGIDRCLDDRQARELLGLAGRMCERGHIRVVGTTSHPEPGRGLQGVTTIRLPAAGE